MPCAGQLILRANAGAKNLMHANENAPLVCELENEKYDT